MPDSTLCEPVRRHPMTAGISEEKRRLEWVDVLRGLAIILVVFGHTLGGLASSHIFSAHDNTVMRKIYDWIYCFHMPAFFFVSGLFVERSLRRRGTWPFIDEKLRTLMYPYLVWSFGIWCLAKVAAAYMNNPPTAQPWRILFDPHAGYWFLYALFVMMLLFALLSRPLGSKGWFFAAVAFYLVEAWVTNTYSWDAMPNLLHYVFAEIIYFASGVTFSRYFFGMADRLNIVSGVIVAVTGFAAMSAMCFALHWTSATPWPKIFPAAAGTLALFAASVVVSRTLAGPSMAFLGRRSLEIYLVATLAPAARVVIFRATHSDRVAPYILGCMLLGLGLPLLLAHLVDVTGWTWIFRLNPPRTDRPASASEAVLAVADPD